MTKALESYSRAMDSLSTLPERFHSFRTFTTELIHQARAKLIHYHVRTSSLYKPSLIRSLLTESISLFPHNTIFLSLFAWNESRFRIEERVREVVRDVTTETKQRLSHDRTTAQQIPMRPISTVRCWYDPSFDSPIITARANLGFGRATTAREDY